MRGIRYRAYIKHLKLMLNVERINFDAKTIEVDTTYGNGDLSEYDFAEVELIQYIGFKDESGKDIYEGDIVEVVDNWFANKYSDMARFTGIVKYGDGSFYVRRDGACSDYNLIDLDMKVIGNIYENKELLIERAEYVYCTECVDFRLCDEGLPYCPYDDKCDISDCEDSKSIVDRPYHGSK